MGKLVNVVLVEHLNKAKDGNYGTHGYYTFELPGNQRVKCGDYIVVDTSKGPNQLAQCICDSFIGDEELLSSVLGFKKGKLKPVKGVQETMELFWGAETEVPFE